MMESIGIVACSKSKLPRAALDALLAEGGR